MSGIRDLRLWFVALMGSSCIVGLNVWAQPEEMWDRIMNALPNRISGLVCDSHGNLYVGRGSFGTQIALISNSGNLVGVATLGSGIGGALVGYAFEDQNSGVLSSRQNGSARTYILFSVQVLLSVSEWPYGDRFTTRLERIRPVGNNGVAQIVWTVPAQNGQQGWQLFEHVWGSHLGMLGRHIDAPTGLTSQISVHPLFVEDPMSPGGAASLIFSTYDNPAAYPHPVWMRTQGDYAPAWIQTDSFPGDSLYVTPNYDDQGNQYWLWRDGSGEWEWLQKYDRDGQPQWRAPLPRHYYAHFLLPGKDGKLPIFMRSGTSSIGCAYIDTQTGQYRLLPLPDPGGAPPHLEIAAVERDPFGSFVIAIVRYYRDHLGDPFGERLALAKISPDWELSWVRSGGDFYANFFPFVMRFYQSSYLYVTDQFAQRIIKFRIRAAFAEGDASRDGCIDDKDLAMTLEAFGTADPTADFDSNGIVDDRDLERVLRNFGLGCAE